MDISNWLVGRKINIYNEKILKEIAKEKGLSVYKMAVNDKFPTYKLIPKKVKDIIKEGKA